MPIYGKCLQPNKEISSLFELFFVCLEGFFGLFFVLVFCLFVLGVLFWVVGLVLFGFFLQDKFLSGMELPATLKVFLHLVLLYFSPQVFACHYRVL